MPQRKQQSLFILFAIPLLAALLVRLLLLAFWEHTVAFDGEEYVKLGMRIASGAGFVDDAGNPYVFRAPGFPYLLGWIYSAFGTSKLISGIILLFLEFLTVPLIAIIATKIGGNAAGVRSAWVWGLQPFSAAIALAHHSDSVALLLLAIVWLPILYQPEKIGWLLLTGIVTGLLALVRPIFQFLPLLIWFAVFPPKVWNKSKWKKIVLGGCMIVVGYAIVVVPWMIRNERAVGSFTIAVQDGGNLYIGWHEGASGGYEYTEQMDVGAPKFTTLVAWNSNNRIRALQFISSHPTDAAKLLVQKIIRSLGPLSRNWVIYQPSLQRGDSWPPANQPLWLFLLLTLYSSTMLGFGWWLWRHAVSDSPILRLFGMNIWLAFVSMWVFIVDPRYGLPAMMAFAVYIGIGWKSPMQVQLPRRKKIVTWLGVVAIVCVTLAFIAKRFV